MESVVAADVLVAEVEASVVVDEVDVALLLVVGAEVLDDGSLVVVTVVVDVTVDSVLDGVDELDDESALGVGDGVVTSVSGAPALPPPRTDSPPWSPPETGVPLIIS